MSPQLVDDRIDSLHVTSIDLLATGVSIGKVLDELVHGRLVIPDSGGNRINGLLASGGGGIGSSHRDQLGENVQHNQLNN